ncbi:tetratricopeptide repeat protein [Dactylosporangium sp. NPDC051484]|uniref:tetratricopeptide repeat protein n=1 Tax=Dactylosporangium sp. NPDC051484 TaxID=3154942 RepID=UPI00344CD106
MTRSLDELLDTAREHLAGWRFEAALQVLRAAYTAARTQPTPDAEVTAAQIAVLYGEVLRETNQLTTAIDILEPLATDLHTRRGTGDPLTVQAHAVLGAVYHDLGRLDEAKGCYQQVLTSRASSHSPAGRHRRHTPSPAAPAAQQHRSPWQPADRNRTGA